MLRGWLLWRRVRDSLWFVPTVMTLGAAALAIGLVRVDRAGVLPLGRDVVWLFGGGGSAAREVLGTIAGSLITVTGTVFSVTVVALQLASSQYSPRVLRGFIGDRVNQVVLGTLIGTFTYALLVMRTIRSEAEDWDRFVPALAVTVALLFLLASVGALIYFINHAARSVRIETILGRQVASTRHQIERVFPARGREAAPTDPAYVVPATESGEITARRGGYLQAIGEDALTRLATRHDLVIRLDRVVGEFVLPGEVVACVWPAHAALDAGLSSDIDAQLAFGDERTPDQDVEFGLVGIADIAVRALSPSLNDPTTAMQCIDRLAELLVELARRGTSTLVRTDDGGRPRLLVRHPPYDRAVGAAFGAIHRSAGSQYGVILHLLDTLRRLAPLVPPSARPALAREAVVAGEAPHRALPLARDRQVVGARLGDALAWLGGDPERRTTAVGGGAGAA